MVIENNIYFKSMNKVVNKINILPVIYEEENIILSINEKDKKNKKDIIRNYGLLTSVLNKEFNKYLF